jgi:MFS transporter, Spinster family, sphingosine-1-phosphate transporter
MNATNAASYAWFVVALLWPVALLNYLDRQLLAAMKSSVTADIPDIITQANWGLMLGLFKWVYAGFSPVGGWVADRIGRRSTICSSLVVWSAVTFATGHVTTFHELLLARTLMGLSEAFYIPAALALISDYHSGASRSRAVGVHQMAIYCGVMLGGFGGYAADSPDIGWRSTFAVCGIAGIVYAVPLAWLLKDPPRNMDFAEAPTPRRTLMTLLANGSFVLLVLYFTLPALAGWVVRDWMPAILRERYQIGQGRAGVAASVYWQAAAIVGAIIGGVFADHAMTHSPRGRILVSIAGTSLMVPAIAGVGFADSLLAAVLCLVVFGLGWGVFDCNNMPILCQLVPAQQRATGYGLMNFVSISCGGLADVAYGVLRDRSVAGPVIFIGFAALSALAVGCAYFIRPRPELVAAERKAEPRP